MNEIMSIENPQGVSSNNNGKTIKDYIFLIYRRKFQILIVATIIFILSIAAALLLPPVYRSSSTILIEQQEIPKELVRSTITSFADQRIQVISQRVMISSNLWKVIEKYNLYEKAREKSPREVIIANMRKDINLRMINAEVVDPRSGRPVEATIAFSLSFESPSPGLAQKVANELTSLYLNENLKDRTQMAAETSDFLGEEVSKLEVVVSNLEEKLALFKEKNVNSLPELTQVNIQLMDRTERELLEVDRELSNLEERKIYLKSELAQLNPSSTVYSESGERILSPSGRLKVLQSEYIKKSAIYSDSHPDILKIKREIDALKSENGVTDANLEIEKQLIDLQSERISSQEKYSNQHPDIIKINKSIADLQKYRQELAVRENVIPNAKYDNPAYIQLLAQLEAANAESASLKNKQILLRRKLSDLEERLISAPGVERDYKNLTRNYDNSITKYQEIKAKQMEAQLAQSLELGRKGERFTLIEPPLTPENPIKPNRMAILFVGILFAIGASLGLAFLMDAIDGNVHGRKAMTQLLGETPIAVIPYIVTEDEIRARSRFIKYAVIFFSALVLLASLAIHLFFIPIDTLFYIVINKLVG